METKYKPGDKVFVRSDLIVDEPYSMESTHVTNYVVDEMLDWCGQIVTISGIHNDQYLIEEDRFCWVDGMFAGKIDDNEREYKSFFDNQQ
ncbi:MAG: hypothetical protein ACI4KR_09185 [Ruminiclostridium sp.]